MVDLGDAHLYARKSSYRGKQKGRQRSVREQLDLGEGWADRKDVRVAGRYIDDDRSASRFADGEREEFERLIGDIRSGRIPHGDVVVAWESSRLHRDLAVYVQLRDACRKAGVLWCINGRLYDLADRHDRRQSAYEAIQNEDESEETSERVKRTLEANAYDGRPHGTPLDGYERVYGGRAGALSDVLIIPERAAIIVEQFQRVDARETLKSIRRDFNSRGIQSASRSAIDERLAADLARLRDAAGMTVEAAADEMGWSTRRLTRIEEAKWRIRLDDLRRLLQVYDADDGDIGGLCEHWARLPQWTVSAQITQTIHNPAYMGKRVHQEKIVGDAMWPAIVDEALWRGANAVLADPLRRTTRDVAIKHVLSGIAECAKCGSPAYSSKHRRSGDPIYRCEEGGCFALPKDPIEDYVITALVRRLSRKDAAAAFAPRRNDAESRKVEADLARWRGELEDGERLIKTGGMTMVRLAKVEALLEPEIRKAEAWLNRASTDPLLGRLIKPDPVEVLAEWERLDIGQQRAVLRAITTIKISPIGSGRRDVPAKEFVQLRFRRASVVG